jgi:hypothetical protein
MDVVANIFGSYIPLCCISGLTFFFFAIAVIALIFFIVALRTSAKAEKIAAAQEEMPMEKAGSEE